MFETITLTNNKDVLNNKGSDQYDKFQNDSKIKEILSKFNLCSNNPIYENLNDLEYVKSNLRKCYERVSDFEKDILFMKHNYFMLNTKMFNDDKMYD